MRLLVDTNIFLEILLAHSRVINSEDGFIPSLPPADVAIDFAVAVATIKAA